MRGTTPTLRFVSAMDFLRIRSGLHEGAETVLPPGRHSVGDSLDDDIVLMGDTLQAGHATFVVEAGRLRTRRTVQAHGTVHLGTETLEDGEERTVRLPAEMRIGDARMTWERGRSGAKRSMRTVLWSAVGIAALGTLLLGAVGHSVIARETADPARSASSALSSEPGKRDALDRFRAAVREHEQRTGAAKDEGRLSRTHASAIAAPSDATGRDALHVPRIDEEFGTARRGSADTKAADAAAVDKAEEARGQVAGRLDEEGIAGVELTSLDDTLIANGALDPEHQPAWQRTQRWFDERFAGEVQLINQVRFQRKTQSRPPVLQAVWIGDPSYVVVGDQKHTEGAVIRGGWTIEAIRSSGVVFARDSSREKVTVKF